MTEPSGTALPAIWGNVPQRNRNFTGREQLLEELRQRVNASTPAVVAQPQAFYGLGGVGKTQLAIEYAYRYASQYDVVWWIPADQPALMKSNIAGLAPRLGITDLAQGRTEDAVAAVFEALRRGRPYNRWLLVFDNADVPDDLMHGLIPTGQGHVIITTRNRAWTQVVDAIEVDVFTREESKQFLAKRVEGIVDSYADRLAEEFGDLPLGLEQAAAWLVETAMRIDVYIRLLQEENSRILAEGPAPTDYPLPVAAAWSLSVDRLRTQTPEAMELLRCCAFFGPAPVPLDMLERGRYVLTSPLQEILGDPILFGQVIRALGRYALVKIDNYRHTLEVHRMIQRVIRDDLDRDTQFKFRHEVHMLLTAADPGNPDDIETWPKYSELLAHAGPSKVVECRTPAARRLAQNIVRYLLNTGDYAAALTSADTALARWQGDSGPDDPYVLVMARLKVQILQAIAQYQAAYELDTTTLEQMRAVFGEDHEETLNLLNCLCIDLWARGDFAESVGLTLSSYNHHKTVFGTDHPRTFAALNNYAVSLELHGKYAEALRLHEELYQEKLVLYGRDDHPRVLFTLVALGRATLGTGQYAQAVEMAERANEGFRRQVQDGVLTETNHWVLDQALDLSIARRAGGAVTDSLTLAEDAHARYERAYRDPDHPRTLAAAASLANSQRVAGDYDSATKLLDETHRRYQAVLSADHPYTVSCAVNLAIIQRRRGELTTSKEMLERAAEALQSRLGRHHHTLVCNVDLASTLAELGDYQQAAQLGESTLPELASELGAAHPDTLACAANLALDLKALGQQERAAELARSTIDHLRRVLGDDHYQTAEVAAGRRLDLGIDLVAAF